MEDSHHLTADRTAKWVGPAAVLVESVAVCVEPADLEGF